MCIPCEAAKARLFAAHKLVEAVEGKYGLAPVLKAMFPPPPPDTELLALVAKLK